MDLNEQAHRNVEPLYEALGRHGLSKNRKKWRAAAEQSDKTVLRWVLDVLDRAANSVETTTSDPPSTIPTG